jgi:hypothetical protein
MQTSPWEAASRSATQELWVPCHHGTARPRVADIDGLQTRVAANRLNKQPRTTNKGWSSSLGVGMGITTPHRKENHSATKCYTGPQTRTDSINKA